MNKSEIEMTKSSLTITIPAIVRPKEFSQLTSSPGVLMEDQPAKRKRKLPIRYQVESEDDSHPSREPERKIARTSTAARSRRQSAAASESSVPSTHPSAAGVDIMNETHDGEEQDGHRSEQSPQHNGSSSKGQSKPTMSRGKAAVTGAPTKKKARTNKRLIVDSEEEVDYMDTSQDIPEEEADGDYFSPDENPTKISKGKGNVPPKRTASQKAPIKRKAKAEPSEASHSSKGKKQPAKKPQVAHKLDDTLIDVVGDSSPLEPLSKVEQSSPMVAKQDSPAPAPAPKKPKLPTIKKVKGAGAPALNTPTSAGASAKKPHLDLDVINQLNHNGSRDKLFKKTDIDLSNPSIYGEIFNKAGSGDGATPRRTKEEERRKELNRLREEAKAKRATEALHCFNLQAQFDKISRFEDRLKAERSGALYPNFLAGKWRDQYDREKRRQKEQEWHETAHAGKEEGEVS